MRSAMTIRKERKGSYSSERGGAQMVAAIWLLAAFLGGTFFGILIIGLMAANEEAEQKERRK